MIFSHTLFNLLACFLIASSDLSAQEHTDWKWATSTASHLEYSFPSESGKLKKNSKQKNQKNPQNEENILFQ